MILKHKVELAWLQGDASSALATKLDDLIIDAFPTEEKEITMAMCENKLKALANGVLYKVSSRQSQSTVDAMRNTINKMIMGSPPPDSMKTAGGVYTRCWHRMQYFIRHVGPGDDVSFGTPALNSELIAIKATLAKENRTAKLWELDMYKAALIQHMICSLRYYSISFVVWYLRS